MVNFRSFFPFLGFLVSIFSFSSSFFFVTVTGQSSPCVAQAEILCNADTNCAAFGIMGNHIQLHGCVSTVPNTDWTIYVRNTTQNTTNPYYALPGTININETACTVHPNSGMEHECVTPPPPSPYYTKQGSIDVGTFENTLFYWNQTILNVENIPCSYYGHAGIWDPSYGNHSYARIRNFFTGEIIVNISLTRTYGFISAFPDYDTGILWLFGTPADRCSGNGAPTKVYTWYTNDPTLQSWNQALAFDLGKATHNVQVTKVGPLPGVRSTTGSVHHHDEPDITSFGGEYQRWTTMREQHYQQAIRTNDRNVLPPHRYAMYLECFTWVINNNADGNLTYGWELLTNTTAPPQAPCGGPSMRYSPYDNYYYILTGGNQVFLYRTYDFYTWEESNPSPFISPSEDDANIAPYQNFPARAGTVGSPPNQYVGVPENFPIRPYNPYWMGSNWSSWVHNSNDADICCMHSNVSNISYIIWGASTQGQKPEPPLTGSDAGTNAVATANVSLVELLSTYFAPK